MNFPFETNGDLMYEDLADGRHSELLRTYGVSICGVKINVPAGFITDFASTPRWLWSIFPPRGRYTPAAVVHDWMYKTHKIGGLEIDRKFADHVFYMLAGQLGVAGWKRKLLYYGIRLGGWWAWNHVRRNAKNL